MHDDSTPPLDRHWTVSVYIVSAGRVALHRHTKLGLWLPAGGHLEPGELPDDAALREAEEETGLRVALFDAAAGPPLPPPIPGRLPWPRPLARPIGVQLAPVAPGHEHIDLIYGARPIGEAPLPPLASAFRWLTADEAAALGAPPDVVGWTRLVTERA
ncbi:MAG: NUDIX hydrolase [Dehalococcoidia bacterium]|nr:MAG: NUDIX hydrolase [Dehalococcoidia bacterium]